MRRVRPVRRVAVVSLVVGTAALLGACTTVDVADAPVVPATADGSTDELLAAGRTVWIASCARCHGAAGGGGAGPRLTGDGVLERYPTAAAMEAMVAKGRGGMPAFGSRLQPAEIEAVVAYVRTLIASP